LPTRDTHLSILCNRLDKLLSNAIALIVSRVFRKYQISRHAPASQPTLTIESTDFNQRTN